MIQVNANGNSGHTTVNLNITLPPERMAVDKFCEEKVVTAGGRVLQWTPTWSEFQRWAVGKGVNIPPSKNTCRKLFGEHFGLDSAKKHDALLGQSVRGWQGFILRPDEAAE
jgi:hypothetical protein